MATYLRYLTFQWKCPSVPGTIGSLTSTGGFGSVGTDTYLTVLPYLRSLVAHYHGYKVGTVSIQYLSL